MNIFKLDKATSEPLGVIPEVLELVSSLMLKAYKRNLDFCPLRDEYFGVFERAVAHFLEYYTQDGELHVPTNVLREMRKDPSRYLLAIYRGDYTVDEVLVWNLKFLSSSSEVKGRENRKNADGKVAANRRRPS